MNNMYNAHVCISGIPAYEEMIKNRLNYIAEAMPDGKFWNNHMDGYEDKCLGIAMIGQGDICALYKRCSLNPLSRTNKQQVTLSTWSVGGCFTKTKPTWEDSIKEFNESLTDYSGSTAIIGYIIFDEDKNPEYTPKENET